LDVTRIETCAVVCPGDSSLFGHGVLLLPLPLLLLSLLLLPLLLLLC
jgi:hypothetical protein